MALSLSLLSLALLPLSLALLPLPLLPLALLPLALLSLLAALLSLALLSLALLPLTLLSLTVLSLALFPALRLLLVDVAFGVARALLGVVEALLALALRSAVVLARQVFQLVLELLLTLVRRNCDR